MIPIMIFLKNNINLESLVIAAAGYLIVFVALVLLLFWFFSMVPRFIALGKIKKAGGQGKSPVHQERGR